MPTRERPRDRGRRLARADLLRIGAEIRTARQISGRSLEVVGRIAGISPSQAGRIERGVLRTATVDQLARVGAATGLDVRVRAYPGPDPVRDAPQSAVLGRLVYRLGPTLRLRLEVPIRSAVPSPTPGDQRAWDGLIDRFVPADDPWIELPVEAETRLVDLQAQIRRITLKQRDAGVEHVLLLVADTRRNRDAVAAARMILLAQFPVPPRVMLQALGEGRHPGGSGIVFL